MGKVIFNMSMSLDGFIAGPNDETGRLFGWYFAGDTDLFGVFKVSSASAKVIQEASSTIGAMVTGRRTFDAANAWDGNPPLGVHHFVVTHRIAQEWIKPGSPFTFVTDGVESAVAQAKQLAGEKTVAISSAAIMQQCLKAGLLDEIHIDLIPLLLGTGVRLFDHLGTEPPALESAGVIEGTGVTHLRFRVVK